MKNVRETVQKSNGSYKETILQFGEGNFLRAFADWMVDEANDGGQYQGSIVLCQPILQGYEMAEKINSQNGAYTLVMRGIEDKKPVERAKKITSVSRCINAYKDYESLMEIARSEDLQVIISNTTEAGITYKKGEQFKDSPPDSFPAKVCVFLYERYQTFQGDLSKGLLFLPVELIDNNGDELKRIIIKYAKEWNLGEEFIQWILEANKFTNTLVDRIVTGYPRDQIAYFQEKLGYEDELIVTSELFHLWVIEGEEEWANILPIHKSGVNVLWTKDASPYKMRKVRILNGGHTATVLAAYLAGHDIVLDFMKDDVFVTFLNQLLQEEVIPTIPLDKEELQTFAEDVMDRFLNPYIKHNLLDISLNSASKFRARCLPSLLSYLEQQKSLPKYLIFSLAAFIQFYKGKRTENGYMGTRPDGTIYPIKDDEEVLQFFEGVWKINEIETITEKVLGNEQLWGENLNTYAGLTQSVQEYLMKMQNEPIKNIIEELIQEK